MHDSSTVQIYTVQNEIREQRISTMADEIGSRNGVARLVWTVMVKTPTGRGEVVRITDHEDADYVVSQNPNLYWKSGPHVVYL